MTKAELDALREAHKPLVAVLKRENPMLEDLPNVEANSGDEHESSVDELRADSYFPKPFKRSYFTCKETARTDLDLAAKAPDVRAFLAEENKAHLSRIADEVQKALVYGQLADGFGRFDGLATYYDSVSSTKKASARNVIDAGGKGASLTSIWVVTPGEYLTRLFHPAGTVEGLEMKDDGEIAYSPPGFYRTFVYKVGLAVQD